MKPRQFVIFRIVLIAIWGSLLGVRSLSGQTPSASKTAANATDGSTQHQLYGTIRDVKGSRLTIETRDKRMVEVDAAVATKTHRAVVLSVGGTICVVGSYDAKGVLHAETIQRAKSSPTVWPADG
jgi:hypothetical protein